MRRFQFTVMSVIWGVVGARIETVGFAVEDRGQVDDSVTSLKPNNVVESIVLR